MKNFLKAKKGKELIEIMVLFPVMLFLIIYTTLNVTCYVISADVEDTTVNYARIAATQRTFYKALCAMAEEMEKSNYEIAITQITLSQGDISVSMSFSDNDVENSYYKNLIYKDAKGNIAFNIHNSDKLYLNYVSVEDFWRNGVYISITTLKGIMPLINEVSKISLYNAVTKERHTLDWGLSGAIYCSTTSVIIS